MDTLNSTEAFHRNKGHDDKKRQQVDNNCQPDRQIQRRQKSEQAKVKN